MGWCDENLLPLMYKTADLRVAKKSLHLSPIFLDCVSLKTISSSDSICIKRKLVLVHVCAVLITCDDTPPRAAARPLARALSGRPAGQLYICQRWLGSNFR